MLAANAAFYAAFNARDTDAMAALWATAAEVSCVHPGWNILRGREAVLESWRSILGNAEQAKIMGAAETAQIVGEVALVVGRELVGGHPIAVSNTFLRQSDGWKLLHHPREPGGAALTPTGTDRADWSGGAGRDRRHGDRDEDGGVPRPR